MIELVITGMVTATAFSALITGGIQFMLNRQNRKITEQTQISAPVSQEMRDEIEQNEAWWLRSYHELMLRSGAKVVSRIHGLEIVEKKELPRGRGMKHGVSYVNVSYQQPDRVSLEGCICRECAAVLEAQEAALDVPPVGDISFGNPILVKEIQHAYGVMADGICGPSTMHAINTRKPTRPMSMQAWDLIRSYNVFCMTHPDLADRGYTGHFNTDVAIMRAVSAPRRCGFEWESMNMPRICQNPAGHGGRHEDGASWLVVGAEHAVRQPVYARGGYAPSPETNWELEVQYWTDLDRKRMRKRA